MGATLRHSAIARRRHRREKRAKLHSLIARASGADKQALEARLQKTYLLGTPEKQSKG